jgi:cation:H+ antiporter
MWLYIFIFIVSCLILARSSAWIVQALIRIARLLGLRDFVLASLLMAFATSLPELFVGISSALHETPQLSFGNVIGSNIIVLTLVMGITTLMAGKIKFKRKILQRSSLYACLIASLPLVLILDKQVSRIDGMILLSVSFVYFYWLLHQKEKIKGVLFNGLKKREDLLFLFKQLSIFAGGILLLLLSAEGLVWSVSGFTQELGLPLLIAGLILVALGTSIPEIAFAVRSVSAGHKQMILGDVMGSIVVNSSLVLGITALIFPFKISFLSYYASGIFFTIITALLFTIFTRTEREISKKEAIILLFIYVAFIVVELLMGHIR